MGFKERAKALKPDIRPGAATNNEEFWGALFCRPSAYILLVLFGDVKWLTPNLLTHISNILLVSGALLFLYPQYYLLSAILLNLALTFDCADGQFARYRKMGSQVGSYYDKVTDYLGLILVFSMLAWVAFRNTHAPIYMLLALLALSGNMMTGYVKWVYASISRDLGIKTPVGKPYVSWWRVLFRIVEFREPDIYFWISVFLILGRPWDVLWVLGPVMQLKGLASTIYFGWMIHKHTSTD
jgi:phosphatidylglycerophosphate synthase